MLYVTDTTLTSARAAEILLFVREYFDTAGLPFYSINFVLEPPRDAEGHRGDRYLRLETFLYTNIYEEGLTDRIDAHLAAQK